MTTFRALVLHEEGGKVVRRIEALDETRLPPGDVTVAVEYSTLNYKDGMILQGIGRLVRNYPHVPGIDFAGTVERSDSPEFKLGDPVILTGWRVGEIQWGGYAEKARVPASFLVRRPGRDHGPPGDGNRHRRLHGNAGGHRSGAAWARARRR
jgi:acrylyl-CoA reductase (NADPH)